MYRNNTLNGIPSPTRYFSETAWFNPELVTRSSLFFATDTLTWKPQSATHTRKEEEKDSGLRGLVFHGAVKSGVVLTGDRQTRPVTVTGESE